VLGVEPEVAALLERLLDPAVDPSLAVRAAIGRWLTPLARTDGSWVNAHRERLLPTAPSAATFRDALWDAFTHWSQPHPEALPVLETEYRAAIDRLRGTAPKAAPSPQETERSGDRLAEHLVSLYWWGAIPLHERDNLIEYFFLHADARRRSHAIQHIGYSLLHAKTEVDPNAVARLKELWNYRLPMLLEALEEGAVERPSILRADARAELREFGWWFASGVFEPSWDLEKLELALKACGNVQVDHAVAERLAELAPAEPFRTASCVRAVDFTGGDEPWSVNSWIDRVRDILRPALESADPRSVEVGRDAVNRIVAAGYTQFRDLL
jgi:hypothetical protein